MICIFLVFFFKLWFFCYSGSFVLAVSRVWKCVRILSQWATSEFAGLRDRPPGSFSLSVMILVDGPLAYGPDMMRAEGESSRHHHVIDWFQALHGLVYVRWQLSPSLVSLCESKQIPRNQAWNNIARDCKLLVQAGEQLKGPSPNAYVSLHPGK